MKTNCAHTLFDHGLESHLNKTKPKGQLLKWIGNKFRFAETIVREFPYDYNRFIEPFVGTGAVLATLAPQEAIAGDALKPLIEIWEVLKAEPSLLIDQYEKDINRYNKNRDEVYYEIRDRFNHFQNPFDLLFLSRTCYGGVIRFRQKDGHMSTPIGPHKPVPPHKFAATALEWRERVKNTTFHHQDFSKTFEMASEGDLIYCDPPYVDSQKILYGAQTFDIMDLYKSIKQAKQKGCHIALSIDGSKKSGKQLIEIAAPDMLFERELDVKCGSSMLKRLQKNGETMIGEDVKDRLLLTW